MLKRWRARKNGKLEYHFFCPFLDAQLAFPSRLFGSFHIPRHLWSKLFCPVMRRCRLESAHLQPILLYDICCFHVYRNLRRCVRMYDIHANTRFWLPSPPSVLLGIGCFKYFHHFLKGPSLYACYAAKLRVAVFFYRFIFHATSF